MQIPMSRSDKLKVRDESPIPITEEGFKRLKEKLARLKNSLPELIAETQRTAAYGDRSDSAEYQTAKSTLRRTHRQILITEDQIKRAVIIHVKGKMGKVELGSSVVLESNGKKFNFQIVGPHETDPARGRISNQSPLGAALMNRAKGDTITIHSPTGEAHQYRILEIQ